MKFKIVDNLSKETFEPNLIEFNKEGELTFFLREWGDGMYSCSCLKGLGEQFTPIYITP